MVTGKSGKSIRFIGPDKSILKKIHSGLNDLLKHYNSEFKRGTKAYENSLYLTIINLAWSILRIFKKY